jgi:hypothetical protein
MKKRSYSYRKCDLVKLLSRNWNIVNVSSTAHWTIGARTWYIVFLELYNITHASLERHIELYLFYKGKSLRTNNFTWYKIYVSLRNNTFMRNIFQCDEYLPKHKEKEFSLCILLLFLQQWICIHSNQMNKTEHVYFTRSKLPAIECQWSVILLPIRRSRVQILARSWVNVTEDFRGLPQSIQANFGIIGHSQISPRPLSSTSFRTHYSLIAYPIIRRYIIRTADSVI